MPFYAIGVFTGFSMAGYGMTKHHLNHRTPGWRRRLVINLSAGILSTLVVAIFAVAKFTEGAWLVVIVFPLLVFTLIRVNREYRAEATILDEVRGSPAEQTNYSHRRLFVLVNSVDLAVLEALRYANSLRLNDIRAVHFMIDAAHAERLRSRWDHLGLEVPLTIIDCPDRRLVRAVGQFTLQACGDRGDTGVTVVLPRRSYAPLLGRLLHDRTADKIARVVNRIPHAAATIIPYDVQEQIRQRFPDLPEERLTRAYERLLARLAGSTPPAVAEHEEPHPEPGATPIARAVAGREVTVEGRLQEITDAQDGDRHTLQGTVADDSGTLTIHFHTLHPDLEAGQLLRITGTPRRTRSGEPLAMTDPTFRVVESPDPENP